MGKVLRRKPSASLIISILALVLAASGTAVAASKLVSGDKLIKKNSVSGNRLRYKTLTGNQINLKKLGTVPNAKFASSAGSATTATSAVNAVRAASSASTDNVKTWYQTASAGQDVTLLTVGPFTYTGACSGTASSPVATTEVATSQANSAADSYEGTSMTPFAPSDGQLQLGYVASGTPPQWVGPNDGSDAQLSGDGHTYVNTFIADGTGLAGAACVFVGHAIVVTH